MQKVTPFLWFDTQAEEAAAFYASVFKNAKVTSSNPMSATFEIDGTEFIAFNGGPDFKFTEAISLYIDCEDQAEVDELWEKLSEGGETSKCGWLKDKFGLSWQVIPKALPQLMSDPDREKANRVIQAMLQMTKIDVAELQRAYEG
jgi:predicted 3-demethylubiquinone-9 3-methyltransferase (glyoxalase superfamily)